MKRKILIAFSMAVLLMSTSVAADETRVPSKTEAPVIDINIGGNTITTDGQNDIKVPGGSVTITDGRIQPGETVTLTINPELGKQLSDWGIQGDYTVVDGSLNSPTITIRVNGNISINPKFADATVTTTAAAVTNATTETTVASDDFDDDIDDEDFDDDDDEDDDDDDSYKGDSDSSTKSPKTGVPAEALAVILLASTGAALTLRKKNEE